MTVKMISYPGENMAELETVETAQVRADIEWNSRGKWYTIASVDVTHNPEYPTPMITVTAPPPGIGFRVYNKDGDLVYSDKKGLVKE